MVYPLEIWEIVVINDTYEVSNLGNIRSKLSKYKTTFRGKELTRPKKKKTYQEKNSLKKDIKE
jgi:hypothetical protein